MRVPHFSAWSPRWLLLPILALALGLRINGILWDDLGHYHPDERYITWVGTSIEFFGHDRPLDAFRPQKSRLNPFYWPAGDTTEGIVVPFDQPRNFAYGHLPLYLGVGFTRLLEAIDGGRLTAAFPLEFDRLTVASRLLTALVDVGTVFLVYRIGRRLFDPWVGVVAAAFLAVTVMHIQLSHFFIADSYLTFFVVLSIDFLTIALATRYQNGQWKWLIMAAVAAGLAIGSKFSAVLLGAPFLATLLFLEGRRFWPKGIWLALVVAVTFALSNPLAVIDFSCPPEVADIAGRSVTITHCYLQNVARESTMVRGSLAFPFVRQYDGTMPLVYPLLNQLNWGVGWPLGVVGFGGLAVATAAAAGRWLRRRAISVDEHAMAVMLAWTVPYLLITGTFQVKFMRYWQPLLPFVVLFGSWLLLQKNPGKKIGRLAAFVVWGVTAVYAFAFVGIYSQPHPWTSASVWLYDNVDPGEVVAVELWDESLPADLTHLNPAWHPGEVTRVELNWLSRPYERDDEAKLMANLEKLAHSDYWVVASNRSYGVITRLVDAYPLSHDIYPHLFNGSLGFEFVTSTARPLHIGPIYIAPDRFGAAGVQPPSPLINHWRRERIWIGPAIDESFTVYDQPLAMIFVNRDRLSAVEMNQIINP